MLSHPWESYYKTVLTIFTKKTHVRLSWLFIYYLSAITPGFFLRNVLLFVLWTYIDACLFLLFFYDFVFFFVFFLTRYNIFHMCFGEIIIIGWCTAHAQFNFGLFLFCSVVFWFFPPLLLLLFVTWYKNQCCVSEFLF